MATKHENGGEPGEPRSGRPIVLFDGVCNICNAGIDFLMRRDPDGVIRYAAMQTDAGRRLAARYDLATDTMDSFYVIDGARVFDRSEAALHLARYLAWPWRLGLALAILPRGLRDRAYDVLARNRYRWFGKRELCRLPTPEERSRFLD